MNRNTSKVRKAQKPNSYPIVLLIAGTFVNFGIAEWRCMGGHCWPIECEEIVQDVCDDLCLGWGGCDEIMIRSRWCAYDEWEECNCNSLWWYFCVEGSGLYQIYCSCESNACYEEWFY